MYLKKLELQGFKSFAQRTILEFDRGVTAIVGPNGSGKSNIADGIRWVLGEQSMKTLRSKKGEDVIFSGSKSKSRLGLAEVSLHLDNENQKIPVSFPEVVIERKLYRNGESDYLLNKRLIKLSDLIELLAAGGFGQKTYSVISQGMIDAILDASPFERKEMFEEASGVKQYQIKKNRAIRKLERTRDNLKQVSALLRELRPRRESLQKQVERAKEKEEAQKEMRVLQKKWYRALWQEFLEKEEKLKKEEKEKKEITSALKENVSVLEKNLIDKEKKSDLFQSEYLSFSEIVDNLQEKKSEIEIKLARINGRLEVLTERGKEGQSEILVKKQYAEIKKQLERNNEEISKNQKELNKELEKINNLNKRLSEIQKEIGDLKELPKDSGVEISEIADELEQVYSLQEVLAERINSCGDIKELSSLEDDARRILLFLEELIEKFDEVEARSLSRKIIKLQKELSDIIIEKEKLQKNANSLQINLGIAENQKESFLSDLKSLEDAISKIGIRKGKERAPQEDFFKEQEKLSSELKEISKELETSKENLVLVSKEETSRKNKIFDLEREFREKRETLEKASILFNEVSIELAKLDSQEEALKREIEEALGKEPTKEIFLKKEKIKINKEITLEKIEFLKGKLIKIGGIDESAITEFEEVEERYQFLEKESGDLKKASNDLKKAVLTLDGKISEKFNSSFRKIDENFNKYFRIIFGGGQAHLRLERYFLTEEDAEKGKFKIGVEIKAVPPGKKIRSLNALSGGEKALASLAILFSIIASNPSPFIVLDEVDASLDEANSRRFAKILSSLAKKTQFIMITHNRETMRQASTLYGVTMQDDGISRLLSVKLDAKIEPAEVA